MYTVRGEGSSCNIEELVLYLIMTYDDEPFIPAAKSVTYGKRLRSTIVFYIKV